MLRTETPMMSGRKSRATVSARAIGSRAKQRSRNRTLSLAASRAEATHARPFGTTGYGWRSRLVLTSSTRAPLFVSAPTLDVMISRDLSARSGQNQSYQRADGRADCVDRIVVQTRYSTSETRRRAAIVDETLRPLCA